MTDFFLGLIACELAAIGFLVWSKAGEIRDELQRLQTIARMEHEAMQRLDVVTRQAYTLKQAEVAGEQPAAAADDVAEVLGYSPGDGWVHHCWVRRGSDMWRDAYNSPGYAVRDANGAIDEGVQ